MSLQIDQTRHEHALAIAAAGRLDSTTSAALAAALDRAVAAREPRVVLDLADVDYISSAGLNALVAGASRLQDARGRLVLCGLTDAVRLTFELAGLLTLFVIEPSRDAALARVRQDAS
jgi:anti-sigma B factor antagonist